jgi:hypothetical protein
MSTAAGQKRLRTAVAHEPQIRCRSACARFYVVCSQCRRFAIRLADSRKHLLFREPTLPHCFFRIESQFFSLSLGRKSGQLKSLFKSC